jgi:hypothetical protein
VFEDETVGANAVCKSRSGKVESGSVRLTRYCLLGAGHVSPGQ